MSQMLNVQLCRIIASEKLADRFLASGTLVNPESASLSKQVALVYLFEIARPWFPSSVVIPSLVAAVEEQYALLSTEGDLGDQFELLLRAVNQKLNSLSEGGETDWIGNFNGLIMVLGGEELHFSQTGSAPAYLLQNNRIRQITDEAGEREPHPLKTFSNLASGALKAGDQVLIANHELYREISLDALRRIIGRATPYQASQVIAKELKRAKNPAVSSIIVKIMPESEIPAAEPSEILLEEEMQSAARKAQKRLSPVMNALSHFGRKAGKAGMQAAQQTGQVMKNTVAPAAAELMKKGAESAKNITEKVAEKVTDKLAAPVQPEQPEPEQPVSSGVVERILPRAKQAAPMQLPPPSEVPTETNLTPDQEKPARPTLRAWLSITRNRKLAALAGAALLITIAIGIALSRQKPAPSAAVQNQNADHLAQAETYSKKSATDLSAGQAITAAQDIQKAQQELDSLQNPTADQTAKASALNDTLTSQSDTLSGTIRLTSTATYSFTTQSGAVLASLPYFYGYASSGLIRTGSGEPAQVQQTVSVPGSSDSIISLAKIGTTDAVAYAFTAQDKIYKVVDTSGTASLKPVSAANGDSFAKGDTVATYNGNLYILDSVTGLFWKYASDGNGGYAKGVSVIDKNKYDISGAVSVAIDGSVYLLKRDGTLLRFTSGKQDTAFVLKNVPTASGTMLQPRQVITDENMQSVYVLDAGLTTGTRSTARVMEFTKDGTFVRQYAFPKEFTKVHGFDVDPDNKKMWVLNDSTVSEFALQ